MEKPVHFDWPFDQQAAKERTAWDAINYLNGAGWFRDAETVLGLGRACNDLDHALFGSPAEKSGAVPAWLASSVRQLFLQQSCRKAHTWGLAMLSALAEPSRAIPFSLLFDWHGRVVCPLAIRVSHHRPDLYGRNKRFPIALQAMHRRAFNGQNSPSENWVPVLKSAFQDIYATSYGDWSAHVGTEPRSGTQADALFQVYAQAFATSDFDAYHEANLFSINPRDAYVEAAIDRWASCWAQQEVGEVTRSNVDTYRGRRHIGGMIAAARISTGLLTCLRGRDL